MANRLYITQQVIKQSGHYELVTDYVKDDWSDNGINYFINEAQRWLTRNFDFKKDSAWLYKSLPSGQSLVTFTKARYIQEVWVSQSGFRRQLAMLPVQQLRALYNATTLTEILPGIAQYWAPAIVGLAPEQSEATKESLEAAGLTDLEFLVFGNAFLSDAIIIMPPSEGACTVEILARWHNKDLVANTDVSFWSVNDPGMLIRATRRQMEIELHRNSEGRKDFEEPLIEDLVRMYHEMIAEQVSGPSERYRMFA